jgi:hypothetical protein
LLLLLLLSLLLAGAVVIVVVVVVLLLMMLMMMTYGPTLEVPHTRFPVNFFLTGHIFHPLWHGHGIRLQDWDNYVPVFI